MLQSLLFAGAWCALASVSAHAQTIEFRATINSAQETTGSTSAATGFAVMLYDVPSNSFDLTVTLTNMTNTITASHVHEGAPGVAGPVVTNLGAESAIYSRNGTTLTTTLINVRHLGNPITLLQNGAYVNFHTAAYPGGEVRGQLIAQPKRLFAILDGSHEVPANPSKAYGAAYISYDPGTNKISTRINVYNFTNTLAASHYHEGALGVSGPVVHNLGGSAVYTKTGTAYGASFVSQTYLGNPVKLLTGGAYLNVHSNISPGGEIRGQVWASDELDVPRIVNISSRGFVGKGEQSLINGFVISGNEPVRVLLTARGPSLTALGVTGALANPMLSLHDSTGTEIDVNDDYGTGFGSTDIAATGYGLTNANESALLLVLPPGVYTTVVTGAADSTGVALTEVYEVRPRLGSTVTAQVTPGLNRMRLRQEYVAPATKPTFTRAAPEFCVSAPATVATTR
jgi:hypothetical protein